MVYVKAERCTGCGACLDVCPAGAISLADGVAVVHQEQCAGCEACVEVCSEGAILSVTEPAQEKAGMPAVRPSLEVIRVEPQLAPAPLRARLLPAVGAALAFVGREIVPRVGPYLLDVLDQRLGRPALASGPRRPDTAGDGQPGRGSRRFRRRRQGR